MDNYKLKLYQTIPCQVCNGKGEEPVQGPDDEFGQPTTVYDYCPACMGSGKEEGTVYVNMSELKAYLLKRD